MDSPQVFDSNHESEQERSEAKEIDYDSLCSTDDDVATLNLASSSEFQQGVKPLPEFKPQQHSVEESKEIPRSIFEFLRTRTRNSSAFTSSSQKAFESGAKWTVPLNKTFIFNVKSFEKISLDNDDNDDGENQNGSISRSKICVVYEIEAVEALTREGESSPVQKSSWVFSSRYSMLRAFYKSLKNELTGKSRSSLPAFPSRKWFGNFKTAFLQKRQAKLATFFTLLSKNSHAMNSRTMLEFIEESRNAADLEFSL